MGIRDPIARKSFDLAYETARGRRRSVQTDLVPEQHRGIVLEERGVTGAHQQQIEGQQHVPVKKGAACQPVGKGRYSGRCPIWKVML